MAAPTIQQIMVGIENRLKTITPAIRTSPYLADTVNVPHAVIHLPDPINYHSTMQRGYAELTVSVTLLLSAAIDRIGQVALGTYLDTTGALSITTAIEGDRSLGGLDLDCIVSEARPLNQEEINGLGYQGGRWTLQIVAKGS